MIKKESEFQNSLTEFVAYDRSGKYGWEEREYKEHLIRTLGSALADESLGSHDALPALRRAVAECQKGITNLTHFTTYSDFVRYMERVSAERITGLLRGLFDEGRDLAARFDAFQHEVDADYEQLLAGEPHRPMRWLVSLLLAARHPDRYVFYKPSLINAARERWGIEFPDAGTNGEKYAAYLSLVESLRARLTEVLGRPADLIDSQSLLYYSSVGGGGGEHLPFKVVKIAPGESAKFWDDCMAGGYICVGWDEVGDLRQYSSKDDFKVAFRKAYREEYNGLEAQISRKGNEVWTLKELEPGDKVVANRGMSEILAVGEVVEPGYVWREDRAEYKHTVAVEWDTSHAKRIAKQAYWGTITVGLVAPDLYRVITGETSMTDSKAAPLKAAFESFRQDPFYRICVKVRLLRAGQLREILSRPDEVDLETFNREFWWGESNTLLRGEDITGVFLNDFKLPPERVAELNAALDAGEVELHGNYVWRPGSHVYSPKEQEGISKEDNIRRALLLLNDAAMTPIEKAKAIQQIHSFGLGTATGAVMMFHPAEFAVYNEQSKEALRKLGYEAGKLEAFEHSARELKDLLGADDFLELDLFLYQINQGKYLAPTLPAGVGWRDAIVRVLREAGGPLPAREIAERVVASGIATGGLTPRRTVSYELTTHPQLFERVSKGIYRLRPELTGGEGRNVWLFQARPEKYDLRAELSKKRAGDASSWSVTANAREMRPGDVVVLWQSGKDAGVYALGELTGEPYEKTYEDGTEPHWARTKGDGQPAVESRVDFTYTTILPEPILKAVIRQDPALAGMHVIRSPQGTNFKVTPEEWEALQKLIAPSSPPAEAYAEPPFGEIREAMRTLGLLIDDSTLRRYHLSLKTRKFVILSGLSGTGKTWLAEAYARAVGARYQIEPVAPNWTTNEDLLGYHNPFDLSYHHSAFSLFLKECSAEYERARDGGLTARPYHLILDEMNLARVEHYFAKFLSAMEVRQRHGQATIWLGPGESVNLTPNLHFVGTVNVDETTHGFAQKVYDRAQLIELQASSDNLRRHLGMAPYTEEIMNIWREVNLVAPFAFRVLDDIKAYVEEAERMGVPWQVALDEQVLQKVLPKCGGADLRVERALKFLSELPVGAYPLTSRKAKEMLDEYGQSGFASFF